MQLEFELTVKVKGNTLDEVDTGLVEAAGQRLRARMMNPPPGPLGQVNVKMPPPTTPPSVNISAPPAPVPQPAPLATVARAPAGPIAPTTQVMDTTLKPKGKPGRKPGSKNKTKPEEVTNEKIEKDVQHPNISHESPAEAFNTGASEVSPASRTASSETPSNTSQAKGPIKTLDDAVAAMKLVNLKFNIDKARECLAHFNVKRATELDESNRAAFVAHCEALCG